MPTQFYELTAAPVDIIVALGLANGMTYAARFQCQETQGVVKIVESATAVTADSAALLIQRYEDFFVKPAAGLLVFAWSDAADAVLVVKQME